MKKLALLFGLFSLFFLAPSFTFAEVSGCPSGQSLGADGQCYDNGDGRATGIYPNGKPSSGGSPFTNSGGGSINTTYLGGYVKSIIGIINTMIVPIIVALAFLLFVWGVYKYYFQAGEGDRAKGHMFILWAVIGFVVIFSVWGIVNLVRTTLSLDQTTTAPKPPSI